MEMATIQFFQNKYQYPKYTSNLTSYGSVMDCTPVGMGLRGGSLRIKSSIDDFMACNYIRLQRGQTTLWAWIDDVKPINDAVFQVDYTVDAWRTFRSKIDLGVQFIRRQPGETFLKDNLLGSTQAYADTESMSYTFEGFTQRTAVIQLRADSAEALSNTPVQPAPYQFYLTNYNVSSWQDNAALTQLLHALPNMGATSNLATIYSIPYIDISGLGVQDLVLKVENQADTTISGFKMIGYDTDLTALLYSETPLVIDNVNYLMQSAHSFQVVIPEAGILNITDEILSKGNVKVRRDIDLFSGACNYMLTTGTQGTDYSIWGQSVRGSSVASIPVLSSAEDTYISQNQNALTTSLIGDVANVAIGFGMMEMGPLGGLLGGGMAGDMAFMTKQFGTQTIASGGVGMMENWAQRQDGGGVNANPPAFLGTALAANFNGTFWLVKTTQHVTNQAQVRANFGYPYNMVDDLVFPSSGYIETQSCNVSSTDGSVPRWALQEINTLFDNGILVK